MTAVQERKAYAYGREREFTEEEFDALAAEIHAADKRGDDETVSRLITQLPMDADVMMAFGMNFGRNFILEGGYDLTEANMKYGEGWLDKLKA